MYNWSVQKIREGLLMKKFLSIFTFALVFGFIFPIMTSAASQSEPVTKNSTNDLVVLDDSYIFKVDEETGIYFPEKIISTNKDANGREVQETKPIDDFEMTDTEIIVDGDVIATFPPALQKGSSKESMFTTQDVCGSYNTITTISRSIVEYNKFIMYHPDFSTWREVSGYYFSNGSVSVSVSVGGTYGSIGLSYSPAGSGYYVNTKNSYTPSRPYIQADIQKHYYKVTTKSCTGRVIDTNYRTKYYGVNDEIKISYR